MDRSSWRAGLAAVRHATAPARPRNLLLAAGLLGAFTLACSQTDLTAPEPPAFSLTSIAPGFLKCSPLAPASASKYVTPGVWDTLRVGPHKLIFKPGSLSQKTLITASFGSDSSRSVVFGPAGLKFNASSAPTLQMSAANCSILSGTLNIVFTDDGLTTDKEKEISVANVTARLVSAPISHFSRYAIHW
jgi:hypothetical protein